MKTRSATHNNIIHKQRPEQLSLSLSRRLSIISAASDLGGAQNSLSKICVPKNSLQEAIRKQNCEFGSESKILTQSTQLDSVCIVTEEVPGSASLPSPVSPSVSKVKSTSQSNDRATMHELYKQNPAMNRIFLDRYHLDTQLGIGGFGFVCKATRKSDSFPVAVKFILKKRVNYWFNDVELGSIPMEIHILMRLHSRFIIEYIEYFEDAKFFYLVTELFGDPWTTKSTETTLQQLITDSDAQANARKRTPSSLSKRGTKISGSRMMDISMLQLQSSMDLFECIERNGGLFNTTAKKVFLQIMEGVNYLHSNTVAHGDLKDENIVIDENYNVKIIDFGSAYSEEPNCILKTHNSFLGTVQYAPPEVLAGFSFLMYPADIWACGVLLYLILCGETPFATASQAIGESYRVPRNVCDPAAINLMNLMMLKNPKKRPTAMQRIVNKIEVKKRKKESMSEQLSVNRYKTRNRSPTRRNSEAHRNSTDPIRSTGTSVAATKFGLVSSPKYASESESESENRLSLYAKSGLRKSSNKGTNSNSKPSFQIPFASSPKSDALPSFGFFSSSPSSHFQNRSNRDNSPTPKNRNKEIILRPLNLQTDESDDDNVMFEKMAKLIKLKELVQIHPHMNKQFLQCFALVSKLGTGGYGFVCEARRKDDGHSVAVKFILKKRVTLWHQTDRIPMEIYLLKHVGHRNVIQYICHYEDTKFFYLVTELFGNIAENQHQLAGTSPISAILTQHRQSSNSKKLSGIVVFSAFMRKISGSSSDAGRSPSSPTPNAKTTANDDKNEQQPDEQTNLTLKRPLLDASTSTPKRKMHSPTSSTPVKNGSLPSVDLFEYLEKHDGLPDETAKQIFKQIVEAVCYLHSENIAHGDLKDENIIIDEKCNVKLIDFGSACVETDKSPLHMKFRGTIEFAPPEVLNGTGFRAKSADTWGLGILLYLILCGEMPFADSQQASYGLYRDPRFELDPIAIDLLNKLLKKDPTRRITATKALEHNWFS
ncbi:hypothetical protein HK100_011073 [Physocladia obscura]|uniref:Protein kinase domain-containing protein n=1 Tax=Physocladia obscura TaxID=109957 RepID=A0AAD5XH89_9FUNG|nr:hypothetical protein HK100_011073 [Physocladia obscura]